MRETVTSGKTLFERCHVSKHGKEVSKHAYEKLFCLYVSNTLT